MAMGLLLLAASFSLAFYNIRDAHRADREAQRIAAELQDRIRTILEENGEKASGQGADDAPEGKNGQAGGEKAAGSAENVQEMPAVVIDGNAYIGILEIPSQNLLLPVMADWDYEKLRTAPCRYSGSYYEGNLVIAGHNYARHFSPIKWMETGSDVYFTTAAGIVYHYTVECIETLQPQAVEAMVSGSWDLTLFTCTTGGGSRCAVRCVRTET